MDQPQHIAAAKLQLADLQLRTGDWAASLDLASDIEQMHAAIPLTLGRRALSGTLHSRRILGQTGQGGVRNRRLSTSP